MDICEICKEEIEDVVMTHPLQCGHKINICMECIPDPDFVCVKCKPKKDENPTLKKDEPKIKIIEKSKTEQHQNTVNQKENNEKNIINNKEEE